VQIDNSLVQLQVIDLVNGLGYLLGNWSTTDDQHLRVDEMPTNVLPRWECFCERSCWPT